MVLARYLKKRERDPAAAAPDTIAATSALLADGAALGAFPDPMAVIRRDGSIAASNAAARRLGALFAATGPLRAILADAVETGEDRHETVDGDHCADVDGVWRVTAHPLPGGAAILVHASDVTVECARRARPLGGRAGRPGSGGVHSRGRPTGADHALFDAIRGRRCRHMVPSRRRRHRIAASLGAAGPER
jgi:hypothetical protein